MSTETADEQGQVMYIELYKGGSGLGFNIRGGTNSQQEDTAIVVTTIRPDGQAALDGRLQVDDKLLEVNGLDLSSVKHEEAVSAFREAKEKVLLKVFRRSDVLSRSEVAPPAEHAEKDGEPAGNSNVRPEVNQPLVVEEKVTTPSVPEVVVKDDQSSGSSGGKLVYVVGGLGLVAAGLFLFYRFRMK